jgi:hypothetical protein
MKRVFKSSIAHTLNKQELKRTRWEDGVYYTAPQIYVYIYSFCRADRIFGLKYVHLMGAFGLERFD